MVSAFREAAAAGIGAVSYTHLDVYKRQVMTLALAACASAEFKFERKIDLVCPWGVGGGADSTLRPMAQLLQGILGAVSYTHLDVYKRQAEILYTRAA